MYVSLCKYIYVYNMVLQLGRADLVPVWLRKARCLKPRQYTWNLKLNPGTLPGTQPSQPTKGIYSRAGRLDGFLPNSVNRVTWFPSSLNIYLLFLLLSDYYTLAETVSHSIGRKTSSFSGDMRPITHPRPSKPET